MKEQLSALMDGEIDLDQNPHLYTALCKSDEASKCWFTYHLIGDALRGDLRMQTGLHSRIMQALEAEPTVLAPRRRWRNLVQTPFTVPMAASAAAIAFVGWIVWQSQGTQPEMAPPAMAQNVVPGEALNNYMLAHHEYAPSNGMQHGYDVSTVTYAEPAN
jgi:sigma-E factor negative regulatory protein RseA